MTWTCEKAGPNTHYQINDCRGGARISGKEVHVFKGVKGSLC